jgi:hypothetical protein
MHWVYKSFVAWMCLSLWLTVVELKKEDLLTAGLFGDVMGTCILAALIYVTIFALVWVADWALDALYWSINN